MTFLVVLRSQKTFSIVYSLLLEYNEYQNICSFLKKRGVGNAWFDKRDNRTA